MNATEFEIAIDEQIKMRENCFFTIFECLKDYYENYDRRKLREVLSSYGFNKLEEAIAISKKITAYIEEELA